tara:strand:+ start:225 stop:2075 length:1851 start_codon:yes stop_codon:yes gene_type:complete
MARRTLLPNTPAETAIDRLLNQTLPKIVTDKQNLIDKEQTRAREDARYSAELEYRVERDLSEEFTNFRNNLNNKIGDVKKLILTNDFDAAKIEFDTLNIEASSADNAKFMNEEFRTRINNVGLELDNNKPFRNDLNDALTGLEDGIGTASQIYKNYEFVNKNISRLNERDKLRLNSALQKNANSPSFSFINNNQEFFTKMASLNDEFYKIQNLNTSTSYESLSLNERELLASELPFNFQVAKPDDIAYTKQREQALRNIYETRRADTVKNAANNYFDTLRTTLGGKSGIEFMYNEVMDSDVAKDSFLRDIYDAADFATKNNPKRAGLDAAGKDDELSTYLANYAISKGVPRSILFTADVNEEANEKNININNKNFVYDRVFTDDLENMSPATIIRMMSENKNLALSEKDAVRPYLTREENEVLSLDAELNILSQEEFPTQNQKDRIAKIRRTLSQPGVSRAVDRLKDPKYLQRRASGGFVKGKSIEKGMEIIEKNESLDEQINNLQNILNTGRFEISETFTDEGPQRFYAMSEQLKKQLKRMDKSSASPGNQEKVIRNVISKLIKEKAANVKKLESIAARLLKGNNLLENYKLLKVTRVGEQDARDVVLELVKRAQ